MTILTNEDVFTPTYLFFLNIYLPKYSNPILKKMYVPNDSTNDISTITKIKKNIL